MEANVANGRKLNAVTVGVEYGFYTVVGPTRREPRGASGQPASVCLCRCRCGAEKDVPVHSLLRHGGSCGCRHREIVRSRSTTHGDNRVGNRSPLYGVWVTMRNRCHNPNATKFNDYGRRGITVCDEWRGSYVTFRDWAEANGYQPGLQIDRKDNDAGYNPDNCRWLTGSDNCRNKRNNQHATAWGETKTVAEWAEDSRCAVQFKTLKYRIKTGWPHEKAIGTPPISGNPTALLAEIKGER